MLHNSRLNYLSYSTHTIVYHTCADNKLQVTHDITIVKRYFIIFFSNAGTKCDPFECATSDNMKYELICFNWKLKESGGSKRGKIECLNEYNSEHHV